MSRETFGNLAPAFSRTSMVHLQGWGEPLLHPDFLDLAERARKAGARVGTTTNGTLLTAEVARGMVAAGLDVVALSLAGRDQKHDRIRQGTTLAGTLAAAAELDRAKREAGSALPQVHVAYMLLRSGLPDIEALPALLAGRGLRQVVISTLDFLPGAQWAKETLVPADEAEYADLSARLGAVAEAGRKAGLDVRFRLPLAGQETGVCPEHPIRAAVVRADGSAAPCVFAGPRGLSFGSVSERPLARLWKGGEWKSFRREHRWGRPPAFCRGCLKLRLC
jgi:radical SAM protein with 4Fe4S-binding SPASM domain